MGLISRKKVAQVGVVLYVASFLQGIFLPYVFLMIPGYFSLSAFVLNAAGPFILLIAAFTPGNIKDEWGSMWPLVGYDNATDAIYTRGPWMIRFQELDELDAQRNLTSGMTTMFGEEQN